jgi:DNA-binding NarL/FixJ family response regulator
MRAELQSLVKGDLRVRAALTLYIVEDSELVRQRLGDVLTEHAGMLVVGAAATARQAIADIAQLKPAVVTIDLGLSSGTGYEVMTALQQLPVAERPVYVVVTNHNHATHRAASIRLGAAAIFDKARDVSDLVGFLLQLRRPGEARRPSGGSRDEHPGLAGPFPPDD